MAQILIDYGAFAAFLVVAFGVVLQVRKTLRLKTVGDISLGEITLRFLAILMIFVKYLSTRDPYLISGHTIFIAIFLWYYVLVWRYRNPRSTHVPSAKSAP